MELRNLKTFLRVAALKNFTAAGVELGYSQANISAQIKQLEREVGAPLFDRIGRTVSLTQYGEALLPYAVSSITINDEREELVDFSTPYYDSNLAIVTLADSDVASASDLSGKPVGAQSGSTGEEWAKENLGDSSYTPYTGPTDALTALRAGKIQAVVLDAPVASDYVKEDAGTYKLVDEIATGEQYGIAINKDNPELKKAIDSALADMQADGTLDKLKQKWLGTSN